MSTTVESKLDARAPAGPLADKWTKCKDELKLVAPNNKRKFHIIVVGSGLAGASAASSLAELGYNVSVVTIHDSPRRAHSIAAQGGINAAKNYQNDGDSPWRLFVDTIKGGDFRSREANVYRLAELSVDIIDQCVAQGVPFAREYGGLLANRTFGGALVSRTFYCRGQTGQQLLLGAYSSLMRQAACGKAKIFPRREMLDLVVIEGNARGIICRNMINGRYEMYCGHAVLLCTGGYGNAYYLSTNAKGSNVTAAWRAHKRGAYFANPCYTQIHPTCIPVHGDYQSKLTLMSESLRNDGRVWVPQQKGDARHPSDIPDSERDYYLERRYPTYGNMVPRDVASRAAKERCDAGYGVGETKMAVYLDFGRAIEEQGQAAIERKYGNLFDMYEKITGVNAYGEPMMIYPAVHYTMGGLWVDYHLESSIPGLFVLGEANFSDHGANRLGASALMQGLADGYFVAPYTVGHHLASRSLKQVTDAHPKFKEAMIDARSRQEKILAVGGSRTVTDLHRELGKIMWNRCGMSRSPEGLETAIGEIRELREEFWRTIKVLGSGEAFNQNLEYAGRLADFLEFSELLARDALHRNESCGGHFREDHQTPEGEAKRDDENFKYVAAWEYNGDDDEHTLHKEPLTFENVELATRSYK